MTNRVAGILTTMEHWLERTANAPLQQFALDREAVSQLVAALKAPADEPPASSEHPTTDPATAYRCNHPPDARGLTGCLLCGAIL